MPSSSAPAVTALSLQALRVALSRRNLPTNGLKSDLIARLSASLSPGTPLTVPIQFTSPAPRVCLKQPAPPAPPDPPAKRPRVAVPARLMGTCVWVVGAEAMDSLSVLDDSYGKANLSRSAPTFGRGGAEAIKGRAKRQMMAMDKLGSALDVDRARNMEHVQIPLPDAYYACFVARRIVFVSAGAEDMGDARVVWRLFESLSSAFAVTFAAYARYRAAGWMPRSGLKYGVDWVLYPAGQKRHSHAPYCLVLSCSDPTQEVQLDKSWIRMQNKLRLVKNVAKSLIIAHARFNAKCPRPSSYEQAIASVQISEVTVDRWIP